MFPFLMLTLACPCECISPNGVCLKAKLEWPIQMAIARVWVMVAMHAIGTLPRRVGTHQVGDGLLLLA